MTGFLLISQIVLVVVLTIAVLLQKSSSIGLGAYSGSNESVFGAKGPGSFLAKTTFFLGFLFVVNTIALGYYYGEENTKSVVDTVVESANVPAPSVPATPEAPLTAPALEATEAPAPSIEIESNSTSSTPVTAEEITDTPAPIFEANTSN